MHMQTPKEAPRFCGSFGCLNIKNRWMAIFIERKRFCHQSPSSMRVLPLVSCGPRGPLWSPVVSCVLLCNVVDVPFPYAVAWFSVCACVRYLHLVFSMQLVCVWSLDCPLIGSFIAFVCSFIRSFACLFFLSVRL